MLGKIVEAFDLAIQIVGENQAGGIGDLHRKACLTRLFIGNADNGEPGTLLGLPNALHRRHLGRLVLKRIKAMQVARQNLKRDHQSGGVDPCFQHHLRRGAIHAFSDSVGTDPGHQER